MNTIRNLQDYLRLGVGSDAATVQATTEGVRNTRELLSITEQDPKKICDELYIKTSGMKIDNTFKRYCYVIINDYLEKNNIVDPSIKVALLKNCYKRHLYTLITEESEMTSPVIQKINEYNESIEGIATNYSWWPFYTKKEKIISDFQQDLSSTLRYINYPMLLAKVAAGAIAVGVATYFTIRACSNLSRYFTTHATQIQPIQQLTSAIPQSISRNTIPTISESLGNIYKSLYNQYTDGVKNSLSIVFDPLKEKYILMLTMALDKVKPPDRM